MAVACSTSAFKVPLNEALSEVASMGFEHVDLICIPEWGHVVPAELAGDQEAGAEEIENLMRKHGLTPVALNCTFANPYQREDGEVNRQRLREVEAVAHLAERLGVKVASFFPGGNWPAQEMDWSKVLEAEVMTVREMLSVGEKHSVEFAIEPHFDTPFQTVEQVARLLDAMPELRIAYDPSHFAMQSIGTGAAGLNDARPADSGRLAAGNPKRGGAQRRKAEPIIPADTSAFLDRAVHVHVRDAAPDKMQELVGEGTVDFDWLLDALAERRYEGHVSIEYLPGLEGDVKDEILKLKERLERSG